MIPALEPTRRAVALARDTGVWHPQVLDRAITWTTVLREEIEHELWRRRFLWHAQHPGQRLTVAETATRV